MTNRNTTRASVVSYRRNPPRPAHPVCQSCNGAPAVFRVVLPWWTGCECAACFPSTIELAHAAGATIAVVAL